MSSLSRPISNTAHDGRMTRDARKVGVVAAVIVAHVGVVAALGIVRDTPPLPAAPIVIVMLEPLPVPMPPPPPPPPAPPAVVSGGGAPAAPSRVHTPPKPVDVPKEVPAPKVQAPKPALNVGIAPTADPAPGQGMGGVGQGAGSGVGDGDGPGSGGLPPRLIRGPTPQQIFREFPLEARRARQSGRVQLRCRIRLDTRVEACQVLSQNPTRYAFDQAALRVADVFRFEPASSNGRPIDGQPVTIVVEFGPQAGLR